MDLSVKEHRMKKFFPFVVLITLFSGALLVQFLSSSLDTNAKHTEEEKKKFMVYESSFSKLKLKTTKGSEYDFTSNQDSMVLMNFWASWCNPCLQEFPSLNKFVEKYKGKILVVGINGDELDEDEPQETPLKKVTEIENKKKLKFESVLDPDSIISGKFLINTFPVTILFNKGKVVYMSSETHDFMSKDFIALIDKELSSKNE